MQNKHLILLSDNYPNSNGEFFLDDEMNLIADRFEEVIILCTGPQTAKKRTIPQNARLIPFLPTSQIKRMLYLISALTFIPLWQEFFSLKKDYQLKPNWLLFKILLADHLRASEVINALNQQLTLDPKKHILYSYWMDYKALAAALIKKKTGCQAVSRCHRWDVYFYAHTPPYLPYRPYLIANLSQIFSISEDGVRYIEQHHKYIKPGKILLSKLGKINTAQARLSPESSDTWTICSCSTLTPVKRVDLIVDFIQKLSKHRAIRWVHFGDGILRDQIHKKAEEALHNVNYHFMGVQPNAEVLNFYRDHYIDLFINFSSSEGIPVSIMEAQSAGIPVLATAVGGTPEIVNDDNGFLVEKDFDMHAAVERVAGLLNGPQEQIQAKREAAYTNWFNNYNAEKNYKEFVELLLTENQNHLT